MKNYCYFMFKPGFIDHNTVSRVKEDIKKMGIKIEKEATMMLTDEVCREHYAHIVDRLDRITGEPIYPNLSNYMLSGPVIGLKLSGEGDIISALREKVGATSNPEKGTWRNTYKRFSESESTTKNGFHCSDSNENGLEEIDRFFNRAEDFGVKILF